MKLTVNHLNVIEQNYNYIGILEKKECLEAHWSRPKMDRRGSKDTMTNKTQADMVNPKSVRYGKGHGSLNSKVD